MNIAGNRHIAAAVAVASGMAAYLLLDLLAARFFPGLRVMDNTAVTLVSASISVALAFTIYSRMAFGRVFPVHPDFPFIPLFVAYSAVVITPLYLIYTVTTAYGVQYVGQGLCIMGSMALPFGFQYLRGKLK